ncbi:hypothetical protein PRIPAC_72173 [Pristionchus pacificus]|uniref:Uncharacterized protein n=1 Tax=Pristionchus pacificus TaxID=54126 RepID=A0A2A6BRJ9_PRIPA|nr:hypothetical protein PRIPAC_72173 [Pristionchus pacificus]|eukprot:PDM68446.1 hypothetical protein PRIPAC_43948 [Pristionchus pacificus]
MLPLTVPSLLLILLHASAVISNYDCRWVQHGDSSYYGDGESADEMDTRGIVKLNGTLPFPPAIVEPVLVEFLLELSNKIKRRVYTVECEGFAEIYAKLGELQNKTKGRANAYAAPEYQTVISLYTESRCRFQSQGVCSREQIIMNPKVQKAFQTVLERNTPKRWLSTKIWLVAGILAAIFVATCCCCPCCKYCCVNKKPIEDTEAKIRYGECHEQPEQEYKNMYPSLSVVD